MFAARDSRTGKFLRYFSGSYNSHFDHTRYVVENHQLVTKLTPDETIATMFCLDTPDGGKLYKTRGGVKASIGEPAWLQIVEVRVALICVE